MLERAFAEESDSSEGASPGANGEPEYTFEGFTVEFSQKIMLTPPALARNGAHDRGRSDG